MKPIPYPSLAILEDRLRRLLPDQYQEPVEPVSMGSAGLRFGPDGRVAWDQIWGSFCDLAMAGGPPHKGTLLLPATADQVKAERGRYSQVLDEICRGNKLAAGLDASPAQALGWVRVECPDETMAAWLLRAITMENVAVRAEGASIYLPAGPGYRLEKEIKNVITVIAKTAHYWRDHMTAMRRDDIRQLFATMQAQAPCLTPSNVIDSWRAIGMESIPQAIRTMRLLVACNILARREGTQLCVPINPIADPNGDRVNQTLAHLLTLEPR